MTVFKLWRKLTYVCAGAYRQKRTIIMLQINLSVGLDVHDLHRNRKIGGRVSKTFSPQSASRL